MKHLIFTILKIKTIILFFCLLVSQTNLNAAWVDATFTWSGNGGYRAEGTFTYNDTYSSVSYFRGSGSGLKSLTVSFYNPSNVLLGTFNNVVDEVVTYGSLSFKFNTTTLTLSDDFDIGWDEHNPSDYYFFGIIGSVCYLVSGSGSVLDSSNPTEVPVTLNPSAPTTQASNITFSLVTQSSFTIACTQGDGTSRAMFVKEGSGAITNPSDNTTYSASSDWSSKGSQLGSSGYYCVYNGTGTTVALTNLSPSTTYYVQVFEYNGDAGSEVYNTNTGTNNPNNETTDKGSLTWDGSDGSAWNTAANWDGNVVPTVDYHVTIPGSLANYPVIASGVGASCYDLTVETGASLTINSGGSLITNGTITNNGTITVERSMTDETWHLFSAPNSNTTANSFLGDYMQYWTENGQFWTDIDDPETSLAPMQGYSVWGTAKGDYSFTGTPNTGEKSITLSYHLNGDEEKTADGMNLVGNPYPSSIDWALLQPTYGTAYVWNPGTSDYIENTSDDIAPMQGFFIYTTNNESSFTLQNSHRSHGGTFYKEGKVVQNGLILTATYGNFKDEWILKFDETAGEGFTLTDDSWKLISDYEGVSQLWSKSPDGKLAIDKRPETETIQLGFANDQAGIYTIGIKEIADLNRVFLEDTKTGIFHNLINSDYQFAWNPETDIESRFKLHFKAVGIEETPAAESNILIYAAGHQVVIKGVEQGTVTISDIMGRVILQKEISGNGKMSIPVNLNTGVYLVTVQNGKEIKTEKVFIK